MTPVKWFPKQQSVNQAAELRSTPTNHEIVHVHVDVVEGLELVRIDACAVVETGGVELGEDVADLEKRGGKLVEVQKQLLVELLDPVPNKNKTQIYVLFVETRRPVQKLRGPCVEIIQIVIDLKHSLNS